MNVIKAQKVPKKEKQETDLIAVFCFYYPQYKYHEARKLPFIRIKSMLKVANAEYAKIFYELTQIIISPHVKDKNAVNKLLERYKDNID